MNTIRNFMSAVAVLGCYVATAHAGNEVITLDGVYSLDAKASDNIKAAIEVVVADVPFMWRKFARDGSLKSHPAYSHIAITHSANEVIVTLGDRSPMRMPIDGTGARWQREDGRMLDTNCQWRNTTLLQTIKNEDWRHDNNFSLNPDGTLTLKVHYTHKRFEKPIEYRLVYRREASTNK